MCISLHKISSSSTLRSAFLLYSLNSKGLESILSSFTIQGFLRPQPGSFIFFSRVFFSVLTLRYRHSHQLGYLKLVSNLWISSCQCQVSKASAAHVLPSLWVRKGDPSGGQRQPRRVHGVRWAVCRLVSSPAHPPDGGPPASEVTQPKAGSCLLPSLSSSPQPLQGWTDSHLQSRPSSWPKSGSATDLGPPNPPGWLSTTVFWVWELGSWPWSHVSSLAILTGFVPCDDQLPSLNLQLYAGLGCCYPWMNLLLMPAFLPEITPAPALDPVMLRNLFRNPYIHLTARPPGWQTSFAMNPRHVFCLPEQAYLLPSLLATESFAGGRHSCWATSGN